ncbi:MAG: hypothetical protein AVDCRST_MAG18-2340 [uncultured Thermomicrobiales bacterium]|uniref:Glycosyltransferase RgtA/B/C/D-like domain-containing protein n=1 Tax=uncultured Thermomicrobiales bacterium TaxID=1645740 RepID=A0A6J4VBF3_9BACT|nr:MAG: hypothetical protein AVDCRST_MAG18-2340 [uncultured Thermomicrobiales bacterium]
MALVVYLLRAALPGSLFQASRASYFNYLADVFLHRSLSLRLHPSYQLDLVNYAGEQYLYWPPLPAILIMPLVALFGVGMSDLIYTAIFGAITVALVARMLALLDEINLAPLSIERRGLLVATIAFGSVLFILAPYGRVWYTSQIVGWGCVLLAIAAALKQRGRWDYFLAGLAFACAALTRVPLLLNGVWVAYYLLQRDWGRPARWRVGAILCGIIPVLVALVLLGWYNAARFGNPLEMGTTWHNIDLSLRGDLARYGLFSLHYLPVNLYYHFVASPLDIYYRGMAGGLFWMTPVLFGAPYAIWRWRHRPLVWSLVLTCALVYLPIGLVISPGNIYGPRYLLDLMPPLLVLTALGIQRWRMGLLHILLLISCAVYAFGSILTLLLPYS